MAMTLIGGDWDGNAVLVANPLEQCPGCGRVAALFKHYLIGPKGRRLLCATCPPPPKETPDE